MKKKGFIIALVGVLIAGVIAAMVLPSMVKDRVETTLTEKLAARGLTAEWASFEAGFGKKFELKDVRVSHPDRGVELTTRSVVVVVAVDSIWEGEPRLEAIQLEGVALKVDVLKLQGDGEPSAVEVKQAEEGKKGLIERLLDDPPALEVENAKVELLRGDSPLVDVEAERAVVTIDDGKMLFDTTVTATPLIPNLPKSLTAKIVAQMNFELDSATGAMTYGLFNPEEDTPLMSYEDAETGALRVGAVSGRANVYNREVELNVEYFSGRIGGQEVPASSVEIPKLLVGLGTKGKIRLTAVDAAILVTPDKRGQIKELVDAARALLVSSEPKDKSSTGATSVGGAVERIIKRIENADLNLKDVKLGVNLEGAEPNEFNKLTLLERLSARAVDGRFTAHGESAGGTFSAEAMLLPGQAVPQFLRVEIEDVNLDKIPGMPSERSKLPSRGTSGHLGGVVSARFMLYGLPLGASLASRLDSADGSLTVNWDDGVIDLTGVSEDPLENIDVAVDLGFSWSPTLNEVRITDGKIDYEKLKFDFSAEVVDFPLDTTFVFRAKLEETDCQNIVRSFPRAALGPYRKVKVEGEVAPNVYLKLPIYRPRGLKLAFYEYEDLCEIQSLKVPKRERTPIRVAAVAPTGPHKSVNGFPEDYNPRIHDDVYWLNEPFIKRIDEGLSDIENVEVYVGPGLKSYVPLEQMPSYVGGAAYLSEQMLFYSDPAISVGLIKKALRLNLERGRFVYGGSTVTQQLVKNLFLSRDKTLSRKLREAVISWRITETISRDRILELYLNCIEFGPDTYGIGPAAKYYFQKDARDLSAKEAIFLAMLKPAPWYGRKVIERKKTPIGGWWAKRYEELFQRLIDEGMLTKAQAEAERPYFLEWDENGKYIDRSPKKKKLIEIPLFD